MKSLHNYVYNLSGNAHVRNKIYRKFDHDNIHIDNGERHITIYDI